jgi:aldose sugar dehydrogenase
MRPTTPRPSTSALTLSLCAGLCAIAASAVQAQNATPQLVDPNLAVRVAVDGLDTPIGIAFPDDNDWFVIEKNTGRVLRIVDGALHSTALDLGVNFASERGLLGIALHPGFEDNGYVYLFWSCSAPPPPAEAPFVPTQVECADTPMLGADTDDTLASPLLGNRVDRFVWNGTSLAFDRNLIKLRAFQHDAAPLPPDQGDEEQPERANHDGGILRFGPDGKLYILFGDVGRRGQLQNLPSGPTLTGLGATEEDDQFGGPQADNAHYSGVVIRLNDDGSIPTDNPFHAAGATMGGEIGTNVQKTFAYGIRNGFGMAFDPFSGHLWDQENGEDAYDELNVVTPGMNSGWIQFMGPAGRIGEYKQIETTSLHHEDFPNLQQFRWGPERIADSATDANARLFTLPGAHYSDPEFSWKYVLAPAAIGFLDSSALGPQYRGDLFVGFSTFDTLGGPLFRFNLTGNRNRIAVEDPRLEDRVMDNATFHEITEGETLLFGTNFGIVTDIQTGPNGNLFVVSLANGTVYEIHRER